MATRIWSLQQSSGWPGDRLVDRSAPSGLVPTGAGSFALDPRAAPEVRSVAWSLDPDPPPPPLDRCRRDTTPPVGSFVGVMSAAGVREDDGRGEACEDVSGSSGRSKLTAR
jgi:hypothetical protein